MSADDHIYLAVRERLAKAAQLGGRGRHRDAAVQLEQAAHSLSCLAEQHRLAHAAPAPETRTEATS